MQARAFGPWCFIDLSDNLFSKFSALELRVISGMDIIRSEEMRDFAMRWLEEENNRQAAANLAYEVPIYAFDRDNLWLQALSETHGPSPILTSRQRVWIFIRSCLRSISDGDWEPFDGCELLFNNVDRFGCEFLFVDLDKHIRSERSLDAADNPAKFAMEEWRLAELYRTYYSIDDYVPDVSIIQRRLDVAKSILEQSKITLNRWFSLTSELDPELDRIRKLL